MNSVCSTVDIVFMYIHLVSIQTIDTDVLNVKLVGFVALFHNK